MSDHLVFISAVNLLLIILFTVQLVKAQGLFKYYDEDEKRKYNDWLRREGVPKTITSIVVIAILVAMWIWAFVNLN
jgi:hypothetical protein